MFKRSSLAAALLGAAGLLPAHAALTTLNFDGAVDTDITNDYAGVTFRAGLASTGPVRTWAASPLSADTGSNVLGLAARYDLNQSEGNAIDVIFDTAVSFVSVRAAFFNANDFFIGITGNPFLAAYNSDVFSAATRLGTDVWDVTGDPCLTGNLCQSSYDTLSWADPGAAIKGIRLSGLAPDTPFGPLRRAIFDTLSYGSRDDGGPGGGGTVPLPSSLALAVAALGLLAGSARARKGTAPR
jgi:hypothetical protein